MFHPPLHYLPVVQRKRRDGSRRPQFVNPLGLLLGGSLFITVALLAVLCSLALRETLPEKGKVNYVSIYFIALCDHAVDGCPSEHSFSVPKQVHAPTPTLISGKSRVEEFMREARQP